MGKTYVCCVPVRVVPWADPAVVAPGAVVVVVVEVTLLGGSYVAPVDSVSWSPQPPSWWLTRWWWLLMDLSSLWCVVVVVVVVVVEGGVAVEVVEGDVTVEVVGWEVTGVGVVPGAPLLVPRLPSLRGILILPVSSLSCMFFSLVSTQISLNKDPCSF